MTEKSKFTCRGIDIPDEFIINKGNASFIKYGGLLYIANQMGTYRSVTRNISKPGEQQITFECEGILIPNADYIKQFTDDLGNVPEWLIALLSKPVIQHGTSNARNTKEDMQKYATEMAETRSNVRCLRVLTGCALTAVEEMTVADLAGNGLTVQTLGEMVEPNGQKSDVKSQLKELYAEEKPARDVMIKALYASVDKAFLRRKMDEISKSFNKSALALTDFSDSELLKVYVVCRGCVFNDGTN